MPIIITGANGFIGRALCSRLSSENKVIGVDITDGNFDNEKIDLEQADPPASPERERPARLALRSIAGRWRAGFVTLTVNETPKKYILPKSKTSKPDSTFFLGSPKNYLTLVEGNLISS